MSALECVNADVFLSSIMVGSVGAGRECGTYYIGRIVGGRARKYSPSSFVYPSGDCVQSRNVCAECRRHRTIVCICHQCYTGIKHCPPDQTGFNSTTRDYFSLRAQLYNYAHCCVIQRIEEFLLLQLPWPFPCEHSLFQR